MSGYYVSKTVDGDLEEVRERVIDALADEGFGVLTEIDVKETLAKKLDVDFRPYRILGACNPTMAYEALKRERMIGTMLPCNVVLQAGESGGVEVAAIDPVASMEAVQNEELKQVAIQVRNSLHSVIENL